MIKQVIEEEIRRAEAEANKANSTTTKKSRNQYANDS